MFFCYILECADHSFYVGVTSDPAERVDVCYNWPPTPITDEWFGYTQRGQTSELYASSPHWGGYNHSGASYWANGVMDTLNGANGYSTNYGVDGRVPQGFLGRLHVRRKSPVTIRGNRPLHPLGAPSFAVFERWVLGVDFRI
jgi:hypothetical protein